MYILAEVCSDSQENRLGIALRRHIGFCGERPRGLNMSLAFDWPVCCYHEESMLYHSSRGQHDMRGFTR